HGYSYVPGVTVTGKIASSGASTLSIGGSRAAHGTLEVSSNGTLTGVLDGRPVRLTESRSAKAGLESSEAFAPASEAFAPSRLSRLVASPSRLAAIRERPSTAVLREVFAAR
ncbi:MAG TPA: hypothetical protein VIG42_00365, partial [Solirubrobacteraceae bacterium]